MEWRERGREGGRKGRRKGRREGRREGRRDGGVRDVLYTSNENHIPLHVSLV